jgi:hypothetical protein
LLAQQPAALTALPLLEAMRCEAAASAAREKQPVIFLDLLVRQQAALTSLWWEVVMQVAKPLPLPPDEVPLLSSLHHPLSDLSEK